VPRIDAPSEKMKKIQNKLPLPGVTPIERLSKPFEEFAKLESSDGILLIVCTVAALLWANSPWGDSYFSFWHTKLTVGFAEATLSKEIHLWINDGLTAIFFLLGILAASVVAGAASTLLLKRARPNDVAKGESQPSHAVRNASIRSGNSSL
jgi:Na+/H+ antiporter 1